MEFEILKTELAGQKLDLLKKDPSKLAQFKAVGKALRFMQSDLHHPGLNTHEYSALSKALGFKVFESYAQNNTPGAYRIFWRYGPKNKQITILDITPHP